MATHSCALACMCLALGQTPSDILVTNQRTLSIPVNIQEARRAEFRELLLYASSDQGRTWQQVGAVQPNQSAFMFTAPADGSYWLRVASINQQGKQEPDNLYQGAPNQKVVIDTTKPLLRLKSPERQGDLIAVAWELQEDNPDWSTFRLEYQAKDSGPAWTPIQATAGLTGDVRFKPATQGPITIRLSFRDQAGNQSFALADVTGTITPAAYQNATTPSATPPAPMFPGVPAPLPPVPQEAAPIPPPAPVSDNQKLPVPALEVPKTFPPPVPVTTQWNPSGSLSGGPKNEPGKIVASSVAPAPPAVAQVTNAAVANQRPLPPLQYVNQPEVTLEYELTRVGPSGVGTIELWWTQNDGQSWELYAVDPEAKSGAITNGRQKRTVELPGDGVYGFILIVKSKAGLGKAPPRAGDMPDIRVEVDTTAPRVDLVEPRPDGQRPNTLLLQWIARDKNLTSAPIMIEWAAKREGPWVPITPAPLANTGKHSWQLPDGLPVQVYLRLRVRDLAGNESVAVTQDPQLVDLSEPEGRLLNVTVSPR